MKVAVVILNWNGRSLLEEFLPSVIRYSTKATIYVADNASTDDSVKYLTEAFPEIRIIQNKVNGGYAKGYNDALKNLNKDIYVLLNSDIEVTPGWMEPVLKEFRNDPNLAAAQPKILDYKNKAFFEYAGAAGGYLDRYGFPYCRGRIFDSLEKDTGQYNGVQEIFWASGACLFIRSKDFHEAGGFDEDYFAHQEEIDLCWRLKSRNKRIICVGNSGVYHVGGATLSSSSPVKTFYNFRNSLYNLYKNISGIRAYLIIFIRLCFDGVAGINFLFQGKPKQCFSIIKAHFSFYSNLPLMRKKRKKTATKLRHYQVHSLVIQFYILGKKKYKELLRIPN